ncbi:MAG TPA: hypothetical protein VD971_04885 [Phycisphaerales bacterium]|nr:hypothetical protein [Phycisphaerales bacterium]
MRRRTPPITVLSVSALVLAALVGVRELSGRPAHAPLDVPAAFGGLVAQTGGLVVLTTDNGSSEDLLLVLDSRNEELFIYRTEQRSGMNLLQRYSLPQLFLDARALQAGTP